ncbi:hypothetical protein ACQGAO_32830 [Rhodococcus sp. 1.20]
MATDISIPQYRANIYSTEAILDPHPHYAELRALGPVVWLARHRVLPFPGTPSANPCCSTTRHSFPATA